MDTIEHENAICEDCSKPFQAAIARSPFDPSRVIVRQRRCEPCVDAFEVRIANEEQKRRGDAIAAQRKAVWETICPKIYRTIEEGGMTDLNRLKEEAKEFSEILDYPIGHRGLILRGGTGAGKTRVMYRLMKRFHDTIPMPSILALSSGEFDRQARDAAGCWKLTEWFDRLSQVDALFIDDIGKGKWTVATIGHFWEVVDNRTKNCRPIFITTNCSGETLIQSIGVSKDIGEPLLRRLRESCKVIVMGNSK